MSLFSTAVWQVANSFRVCRSRLGANIQDLSLLRAHILRHFNRLAFLHHLKQFAKDVSVGATLFSLSYSNAAFDSLRPCICQLSVSPIDWHPFTNCHDVAIMFRCFCTNRLGAPLQPQIVHCSSKASVEMQPNDFKYHALNRSLHLLIVYPICATANRVLPFFSVLLLAFLLNQICPKNKSIFVSRCMHHKNSARCQTFSIKGSLERSTPCSSPISREKP